jgi:hypothetical protein
VSTDQVCYWGTPLESSSQPGFDELFLEFALEFVLAGLEVGVGDDVAEDEVEDCGAEGEERVYALGAVLVQADVVEVGVCGQAAETVRCLSRQCQGYLGHG